MIMKKDNKQIIKNKEKDKRLRLVVSRSNRNIFAQIVDDTGKTLLGMSTLSIKGKNTKKEASFKLGELMAKEALKKKIKKIAFDRNGYRYHGRIKALAEGLRKGGLEF